MARTDLTVSPIVLDGKQLLAAEADGTADGKQFLNTGDQMIYCRNSSGAATRDVELITTNETAGGASYTVLKTITIPISGAVIIGPFETAVWNTAANLVYVDFDTGNESDVKIVALSFARAR